MFSPFFFLKPSRPQPRPPTLSITSSSSPPHAPLRSLISITSLCFPRKWITNEKRRRRAFEEQTKKQSISLSLFLFLSFSKSSLFQQPLLHPPPLHALLVLLPDERIPPTTELAMPAAANSAAATARASVVSPARLKKEGRLRQLQQPTGPSSPKASAAKGADSVKVLGAALGTAARLTALVVTAVAVAAVAVAALATIAPLGAGAGAAMTALGVAAAPCEELLLFPLLPKVTLAEVGLNAGAAVFLFDEDDALAGLLLLAAAALGLLLLAALALAAEAGLDHRRRLARRLRRGGVGDRGLGLDDLDALGGVLGDQRVEELALARGDGVAGGGEGRGGVAQEEARRRGPRRRGQSRSWCWRWWGGGRKGGREERA